MKKIYLSSLAFCFLAGCSAPGASNSVSQSSENPIRSSAAPTSAPSAQSPMPSHFKIPKGNQDCAGEMKVARGFGDPVTVAIENSSGFIKSEEHPTAYNLLLTTTESLETLIQMSVENLNPGKFDSNFISTVLNKGANKMTVMFKGKSYFSFSANGRTASQVVIDDNRDGYIWGSFDGTLLPSDTNDLQLKVSGTFACKVSGK